MGESCYHHARGFAFASNNPMSFFLPIFFKLPLNRAV